MIALGMVAASYILVFCPQQDATEELKKENAELKKKFEALQEKVDHLNTKLELYETKPAPPPQRGEIPDQGMAFDDNALLTALKDTHISGFVEMGYEFSFNNLHASSGASVGTGTANAGGNPIRTFDTRGNSFYLNHAQLMLEKIATEKMIVGYRFKLDVGNDPFIFDGQTVTCEEGYIEFLVPLGRGLDIKAGKMATLAGAEVIEAKDDMNYSRSILFGFAIPFTHTGVRAIYAFNDYAKTTIGFNNGWNLIAGPGALAPSNLNTFVDANHGKTLEYQLEVKPIKEFTVDATLYVGDENGTTTSAGTTAYATQYVADLVANFSIGKVTLVANFDWGAHESDLAATGHRASWSGIAGYAKYQFTDVFASSLRAEYFSDHDGRIAGPAAGAGDSGTGARYFEFTLTAEFKVASTAIVRVEIRHDDANNHVFTRDSKPARGDTTMGFEAILPF